MRDGDHDEKVLNEDGEEAKGNLWWSELATCHH
jgi:hypothetical protein